MQDVPQDDQRRDADFARRILVKSCSSIQAIVAISSGEAEYNALVRGIAEAFGLKAVLDELGWEMPPTS